MNASKIERLGSNCLIDFIEKDLPLNIRREEARNTVIILRVNEAQGCWSGPDEDPSGGQCQ